MPKLIAAVLLLCLLLTACSARADNRLGGLRRVSLNMTAAGFPAAFSCPSPCPHHYIWPLDTPAF